MLVLVALAVAALTPVTFGMPAQAATTKSTSVTTTSKSSTSTKSASTTVTTKTTTSSTSKTTSSTSTSVSKTAAVASSSLTTSVSKASSSSTTKATSSTTKASTSTTSTTKSTISSTASKAVSSSTSTSITSTSTSKTTCSSVITTTSPTVVISLATVIGARSSGIDTFNGIPFAQPPVGSLRLVVPQSITTKLGTITATGTPSACPQFAAALPTADLLADGLDSAELGEVISAVIGATSTGPQGEDCLTLNVQRPAGVTSCDSLPVAVWIYGGGFEFGSTQANDATNLINASIAQGKDIIYVQMNYRLSGYGFMPGAEIQNSGNGNIGLLDQRMALHWVADNIAAFGGDPARVSIFGESAGSISVFNQMAMYNGNYKYNGKPLFHGAIMDSGSVIPADYLNCTVGQNTYNSVVKAAGCNGTSDTLACLRALPFATFNAAVNSQPGIFSYDSPVALPYLPRPDGTVITKSPDLLIAAGQYAPVPFIIGDQQDEGTLFAIAQTNITTQNDLINYLATIFYHDATISQITQLVDTYPDDPSAGSPFGTGVLYNVYPEYKRLAAMLGDLTFTLTRRILLTYAAKAYPNVPTWSYLSTYDTGVPVLGTFHASDIGVVYGTSTSNPIAVEAVQAYYISFFNTLNPNSNTTDAISLTGTTYWPQWTDGNLLLDFEGTGTTTITDDFRQSSFTYFMNNAGSFHV